MAIMYMLKQSRSDLHMHKRMRQNDTCGKVEDIEINVAIVHDSYDTDPENLFSNNDNGKYIYNNGQ